MTSTAKNIPVASIHGTSRHVPRLPVNPQPSQIPSFQTYHPHVHMAQPSRIERPQTYSPACGSSYLHHTSSASAEEDPDDDKDEDDDEDDSVEHSENPISSFEKTLRGVESRITSGGDDKRRLFNLEASISLMLSEFREFKRRLDNDDGKFSFLKKEQEKIKESLGKIEGTPKKTEETPIPIETSREKDEKTVVELKEQIANMHKDAKDSLEKLKKDTDKSIEDLKVQIGDERKNMRDEQERKEKSMEGIIASLKEEVRKIEHTKEKKQDSLSGERISERKADMMEGKIEAEVVGSVEKKVEVAESKIEEKKIEIVRKEDERSEKEKEKNTESIPSDSDAKNTCVMQVAIPTTLESKGRKMFRDECETSGS